MTKILASKTSLVHFHLGSWIALDERFVVLFRGQSTDWALFWIKHLGIGIVHANTHQTEKSENCDIGQWVQTVKRRIQMTTTFCSWLCIERLNGNVERKTGKLVLQLQAALWIGCGHN